MELTDTLDPLGAYEKQKKPLKIKNVLNRYGTVIKDTARSSALYLYETSLGIYRTSRDRLKKNKDKVEVDVNACFIAAWPFLVIGDANLNYQQLNMLTGGENTLRAAINGAIMFSQIYLPQWLLQYLPNINHINNLF